MRNSDPGTLGLHHCHMVLQPDEEYLRVCKHTDVSMWGANLPFTVPAFERMSS